MSMKVKNGFKVKDGKVYAEVTLREIAERYGGDDPVLAEIRRLYGENDGLRDLVRLFADYVGPDRCEGCVTKTRCNDGLIDECWIFTMIREMADDLGIEIGPCT